MNKPIDHTEVLTRAATRVLDQISFTRGNSRAGHDTWYDDAEIVADAVAILREELGATACEKCGGAVINLDAPMYQAGLCGCGTSAVCCHVDSIEALRPFDPNVTLAAMGIESIRTTPERSPWADDIARQIEGPGANPPYMG